MDISRKRQPRDILLGFFLLSHPGPVLFHVIAVAIFAALAGWPNFSWTTLVLVISAHACMQFSIAMLNDYCDRRQDAQGKPEKPIPRGLVTPREALVGGLLMIVLMLVLLLPLPPLALILSLCYLALGQGYNLGLKSTPLSGIVFALAMPLIPLYAFASMGRTFPFLFWLVPIGFFLGVALNLANSLPDIEEDAASGARTLAVTLGARRSFVISLLLITLTAILIGALSLLKIIPVFPWILSITLILTCLALIGMALFFSAAGARRTVFFYLVVSTSIVLVGGWLIGALI